MSDVLETNEVIAHLKAQHVVLQIFPIPESEVRHFVISDSAYDPTGKTKPQHGWLQGISNSELNAGASAPMSLIGWTSKRLRRKAGNTLLCESIALSTALGAAEKQVSMWDSFCKSHYSPRENLEPTDEELGLRSSATVIAEESVEYRDPYSIAIVDAKSLFDGASSEQAQGEDDRSALEIAIIQESLAKIHGRMRWIPHNKNPADALTKLAGAHMQPMMQLLRSNRLQIEEESEVLQQGKQSAYRMKAKA